jgi:hypothetical protein
LLVGGGTPWYTLTTVPGVSANVADLCQRFMNLNQFYMARLMAAPKVIIELALMGSMYSDRRRNAARTCTRNPLASQPCASDEGAPP